MCFPRHVKLGGKLQKEMARKARKIYPKSLRDLKLTNTRPVGALGSHENLFRAQEPESVPRCSQGFLSENHTLDFAVFKLLSLFGDVLLSTLAKELLPDILEDVRLHFQQMHLYTPGVSGYLLTVLSSVISNSVSLRSLKLNRRINHKRNLSNTVAKHFLT